MAMPTPTHSLCPKCGAPISDGAPQGLCPKCVMGDVATAASPTNPRPAEPPHPSVEEIAAHFPDLHIIEVIGVGGMAAVYKARQPKLDRFVALKVLSRELAGDPAFVERFAREARVLARLNHQNIVAVFDCGVAGPFAYLVMEYVDGVNLRQAMQAGRFASAEVLALVQVVCGALKFAHDQGILHRDIKPENILIDTRGGVKIADFGIAKLVGEKARGNVTLTMEGVVLGSPNYMAPEQFNTPGDVDQRADIYSLGVVIYELLTGELPRGRFLPPSRKSDVDARIDEIVMRTLECEREARYQTVGEVKTRVEAVADSKTESPVKPASGSAAATGVPSSSLPSARFATPAAVCTGISLVLAALSVAYGMMVYKMSTVFERPLIPGSEFIILAVALVPVGALGFSGILLGRRALRDVRDSKGNKKGFTGALFAALAWPVVLGFVLPAVVFWAVMDSPYSAKSIVRYVLLSLPVGGFAAFLLIRRVSQWARPASPV